ncbi:MAG: right-handed parallel beta-helix repeat-containing protein, partial [Sedimentisphaerales bacterium]|nr:right-handed parallel beta-helix repeat-containing protein [Sedimentisphaerales bacterium]
HFYSAVYICTIYNNTVRVTGLITEKDDRFKTGISVHSFDGNAYAKIYNNRIEDTVGAGMKIGRSNHQIYNNEVLGCGKGGDGRWANGILLYYNADSVDVYDNIIIQPTGYGIYATSNTSNCTDSRNLTGDAGLGERYDVGGMTEGIGNNANIYHADVADFGFKVWSDDGDYSNDDFSLRDTSLLQTPQTGWSLLHVDIGSRLTRNVRKGQRK